MQINPKEILFGQPILKIREVVRRAMQEKLRDSKQTEITVKVAAIIQQPKPVAIQVIKQLIQEDYLIINKVKYGKEYYYELTDTEKGRRFGIATATPPISRQKANQLLLELIERAKAINTNSELVYYVERLKVFGSYLSDKDTMGDLDIGFKLSRRHKAGIFTKHNQQRIYMAKANGRRFINFTDELEWPRREVILLLKARKRGLSLHDEERDEVFKITKTKLIYHYETSMARNLSPKGMTLT
jgi:hypothetical protein